MANLRGIGEGLSVTEGNDDRLTSDGTSFILKMSVGGRNKRIPSRISGGTSDNETKRIVGPTLGVDGDRCCERYCKPKTKAAVTKSFGHPRDVHNLSPAVLSELARLGAQSEPLFSLLFAPPRSCLRVPRWLCWGLSSPELPANTAVIDCRSSGHRRVFRALVMWQRG